MDLRVPEGMHRMKNALIGAAILAGAIGAAVVVPGAVEVTDVVTEAPVIVAAKKAKPVEFAAVEVSEAPEDMKECPGGVVSTGDSLLCFRDKAVEAAPSFAVAAEKDRWSMWACPATEERGRHVEWTRKKDGCVGGMLVLKAQHKATWQGETEITAQLRERCAPCPVSSMSHGQCPLCLLAKGGCASACKATTNELTGAEVTK